MNITETIKEALYAQARMEGDFGMSMVNGFSGADRADSEYRFCARRVYVAVAGGMPLEDAIAREDKNWRAYATEQVAKVNAAPKIKRGPMSGHSAISHRWVDAEKFANYAHHIRTMIKIIEKRAAEDAIACEVPK